MKLLISLILFFSIFFISCQKEEEPEPEPIKTGSLNALVLNKYDQAIKDAEVKYNNNYTNTDANGNFFIKNLPAGENSITISKEYYNEFSKKILIKEDSIHEMNFILESKNDYLAISDSIIDLQYNSDKVKIDVKSNTDWEIVNVASWLKCSTKSGAGDGSFTIESQQNISDSSRIDTLFITTSQLSKRIILKQDVALKLLNHKWVVGNQLKDEVDSISFTFNKKISVISVVTENNACYPNLKYKLNKTSDGFSCSGFCSSIGDDLPISFQVSDLKGDVLRETVNIPLYNQKFTLKGGIRKVIVDENNVIWALTDNRSFFQSNGSNLYKFICNNDSVILERKIELGFDKEGGYTGGDFFINPHNNLVYVCDYYGKRLVVYSNYGDLEKIIPIPINPNRPTQYQKPYSIGFNISGKGIIALAGESSGLEWRYIDSSKNDEMDIPDIDHPYYFHDFSFFGAGYENDRLYITEDGYGALSYLDEDGSFINIDIQKYYNQGNCGRFIVNKNNSNIFIQGQYYQQIISFINNTYSEISYSLNFDADFSYNDNYPNSVFGLDDGGNLSFNVYSTAETLFSHKTSGKFSWINRRSINSTIDDKFIILSSDKDINNEETNIYFIDTQIIYRIL